MIVTSAVLLWMDMMKKILLIMVGGTICTAVNERGTLSVHPDAGALLVDNFKRSDSFCAKDIEFVLTENLMILSENMSVKTWNRIISLCREKLKEETYDGIIFAHGTDTLAYSAALFSQLLGRLEIPVFFVSSHTRLDAPKTNGNDNFRCAVECIAWGIAPNIYVAYRNVTDDKMYLHLASRITQCQNYSDDFTSYGAIDINNIDNENYKAFFAEIERRYPQKRKSCGLHLDALPELSDCVLMISPYVGMRYDALDYGKVSAVLHGTYHSGTACAHAENSNNSLLYMLDACSRTKTDVYLAPSKAEGEIYDTVRVIASHGNAKNRIRFLYGYTNEMAYVKLLLAYSVLHENERDAFIRTEWNFERIDNK